MSLRISSAAALAVAGCSQVETAPLPGQPVRCTLGGAVRTDCRLEAIAGGWLLHHPDGGFRRIAIDPAGGMTTDGAVPVSGSSPGIIAIGDDRYEVPVLGR